MGTLRVCNQSLKRCRPPCHDYRFILSNNPDIPGANRQGRRAHDMGDRPLRFAARGLRGSISEKIEYLAPADWRRQVRVDTNGAYASVTAFLEATRAMADELIPITCRGEMSKRAVVIISVMRNEMQRLPSFLAHYRRLGADRFLIVDNASNDGTDRFLSKQPDVDLWLATGSYLAAHRGRMWTDGLAHAIARGHWVMIADADEFLVYAGMDRHALQDLVGLLDRRGERRIRAPLIDVYGRGPIRNTPFPQGDPLAGNWWFDATSYKTLQ